MTNNGVAWKVVWLLVGLLLAGGASSVVSVYQYDRLRSERRQDMTYIREELKDMNTRLARVEGALE